jgi:aldehyde dehydrogenase (NAD+)
MSSQIMITSKKGQGTQPKEEHMEYAGIVAMQRDYFNLDVTKPVEFRINQLKKMKKLIRHYEDAILEALRQDLGRHPMEGYVSEIMLLINEINSCIKKLKTWVKPKPVKNNFFLMPAKSKIHYEPFGVCLIISPWNFPFFLTLRPLIGAICAGNCATLKCSENSPNTSKVILEMINQHFPQEYLYALSCDQKGAEQLIQSGYDFILYTGSATVGKQIMKNAADTLTPVVLELGGKSPVIVDETADVNLAAKRIVWGKYINSGQTCIAPDYIYVHISRKNDLIKSIVNQIIKCYGKDPVNNPDYGKIINETHFQRLIGLLSSSKLLFGGNIDENQLKIEPTLVEVNSHHEPIMQEECI